MAASALGASCYGFDVNPLACLITKAKAADVDVSRMKELAREAAVAAQSMRTTEPLRLRNSKVQWLSDKVAIELAQIVEWLTAANLSHPETLVAGVALSAATRDAAWIRKSGWKLHRMDGAARATHDASAWTCFIRRMNHYFRHADKSPLNGAVNVTLGSFHAATQPENYYDVVLTSPPYGDSRTTVQYGAASGICLDVVARLPGLEHLYRTGGQIDRDCLGTTSRLQLPRLRPFWAGAAEGEFARRVSHFLSEYREMCGHLCKVLAPDGTIVMVVGRRSVGGFRVRLDDFSIAVMEEFGLRNVERGRRQMTWKTIPRAINRFARASDQEKRNMGRVKTMDEEMILTFRFAS
jgi:hypothetical protein